MVFFKVKHIWHVKFESVSGILTI